MAIVILDPFSGISGDMTLGALVDIGLDPRWLAELPGRLRLPGVHVRVSDVQKCGIACKKVDFDIPPQPHGRHLREIRQIVDDSVAPGDVKARAEAVFLGLAEVEASIHGTQAEKVHLHEVGAVDAILDVVGAIWGLSELGISRVYCGTIALGDGFVETAHGTLPVPAPATLRLLEGFSVRPGPEGAGELVTPTGAALVRVLSSGPPPGRFIPRRSGFGAGTRDLRGRPNALRAILADPAVASEDGVDLLAMLAADVDDMPAEHLAGAAEELRALGALDVTATAVQMKKGRMGTRIEVLCQLADAGPLEDALLLSTSSLGVRRSLVERRALARVERTVQVLGHDVRMKIASLPGGARRSKPEFDDIRTVSRATGRSLGDIATLAQSALEHASSPERTSRRA